MAEDAARILRTIPYATLATVDDSGRPWNSPVAAVIAADLAVYWFSDSQAQHSRNVRANGRVFIVVYDSTWPANTGAQGVFMRARAEEVANKLEIAHACALKGGSGPQAFAGNNARRVYKAAPECMWINATQKRAGKFVRDYRLMLQVTAVQQAFNE